MTRENKLALVVGFGLILFVGILISDHFSVVRTQQAANLTEVLDPLIMTNVEPVSFVDLIERMPRQEPTPPATQLQEVPTVPQDAIVQGPVTNAWPVEQGTTTDTTTTVASDDAVSDMLTDPPAGFVAVPNPEDDASTFVFHDVRSGDTFYSICRQHFGDSSQVKALAAYNNIDDPASLRVGQRLRIPSSLNGSANETTATSTPAAKPKPAPTKVTYTVKAGDTLAVIAQRFLGSKNKWKKLYDMNRDVIDDPDNVKVGTVLRVL